MFGILYLLFPFQPTSDSYKRYGVTLLRCYGERRMGGGKRKVGNRGSWEKTWQWH